MKTERDKKAATGPMCVCVCVIAPVTMRNVRAATALLGSGAADALSDAFDNGFI